MSIVKSATNARLRFNHRGGADADRQLLGVVIEKRIPGGVPVSVAVDQPTVLPQSDDAQRNGTVFLAQPYVIETAPRPLVTSVGGIQFRSGVRTLSTGGGSGSGGPLLVAQVEPSWAPVGISSLTVVAFGNGGTDTVIFTPLGGGIITLTEGTDFTAETSNDVTAENIRVALLAAGVLSTRAGAVLTITSPLTALVSNDLTAWEVVLAASTLAPAPVALVPMGRYVGSVAGWATDPNGTVPNAGHSPAGHLLRVRWLGATVEAAEIINAGGNTGFTFQLLDSASGDPAADVAPGSVVIFASVGGNIITIRDTGGGRLVGQEAVANESADGTIDYRSGIVTLVFTMATAGDVTANYEHACLYLPLDINLEWDAELA